MIAIGLIGKVGNLRQRRGVCRGPACVRMMLYIPSSTTMNRIFRPHCVAVASSCPFIMKQPSPATETASRSGKASLAAIAAGAP
ncbi:hypothetical protein ASE63_10405 [Bosea sp. Root381]|nr:hypothetical protein ASE63_10405 [Bosea sp. Root381]